LDFLMHSKVQRRVQAAIEARERAEPASAPLITLQDVEQAA
jgi:hypothetical protein